MDKCKHQQTYSERGEKSIRRVLVRNYQWGYYKQP